MIRVAWLTDLHLDFLPRSGSDAFMLALARLDADAFLLGGDTGQARSLPTYLTQLDSRLNRPIYFVLGNHDCYGSSISSTSADAARLAAESKNLRWLNAAGVVPLGEQTALIGHGSWGDARLGNVRTSPVRLNDFDLIEDLRGRSPAQRARVLNALGDEAALSVGRDLCQALESFQRVILLTHVPPFREACIHDGTPSDDDWLPYFCCHAVGERIRSIMDGRADRHLTVLCGHTHGEGRRLILPNLEVWTGGAEYGRPRVQETLDCI